MIYHIGVCGLMSMDIMIVILLFLTHGEKTYSTKTLLYITLGVTQMAISDEAKSKAVGQFKLQLGAVMAPFHQYGMGVHITPAIDYITELALLLHKRLNGNDVPITVQLAEQRRRKRYMK